MFCLNSELKFWMLISQQNDREPLLQNLLKVSSNFGEREGFWEKKYDGCKITEFSLAHSQLQGQI